MSFGDLFLSDSLVLLDGGLGTTLENLLDLDISNTPLWSAKPIDEQPEAIIQAHLAFMRAGARLISTSTYQCSFNTFTRAGYTVSASAGIMRKSIALAEEARTRFTASHPATADQSTSVRIVLSLGPFGASLSPAQEYDGMYPPPYGPVSYEDARNGGDSTINAFEGPDARHQEEASIQALTVFHYERLVVFADNEETWATIDCIAFETVPLLREITAIRRAMGLLEEYKGVQSKPWWISLVFPDGHFPEGQRGGFGHVSVQHVIDAVLSMECEAPIPNGVGINCTQIEHLEVLLPQIAVVVKTCFAAASSRLWLVVYPNGGDVYDILSQTWKSGTTDERHQGKSREKAWASDIFELAKRAQNADLWEGIILGGCCRAGPAEIKELRSFMEFADEFKERVYLKAKTKTRALMD